LTSLAEGGINQGAADAAHPADEDDEEDAVPTRGSSTKKRTPVTAAKRTSPR